MRDAGKHLTMLKTSPPPYLRTQNYLCPDVSRTGAETVCPGAVTLHNQLIIRPRLESLNSQFQVPEEGFLEHLGSRAHQDWKKRAGLCCTNITALAIIWGRNETEAISRKGIVSRNLVGFHYSSLLDFLSCKKRKVSTLLGIMAFMEANWVNSF